MSRRKPRSASPDTGWRLGAVAGLAAVVLGLVGLGGGDPRPLVPTDPSSRRQPEPFGGGTAAGATPARLVAEDSGGNAHYAPIAKAGGSRAANDRRTAALGAGNEAGPARPPGATGGASQRLAGTSAKTCGERAEGAVDADTAETLVGQSAAVEFRVARTFDSGKVTFLNSQDPYEGHFYVAIFPDDYGAFPEPPAVYFDGQCIVVQGRVELYRGTPQIVLNGPEDIVVVGD